MTEQTRHELNAHHSGTEFIECAKVSEIPDEGVIAVISLKFATRMARNGR